MKTTRTLRAATLVACAMSFAAFAFLYAGGWLCLAVILILTPIALWASGFIRFYLMRNTADASIKCCGAWLHVRSVLIGVAPAWWWTNRSYRGPVRVFGLSILTPGSHYDRYVFLTVAIGGHEYGWRRNQIGMPVTLVLGVRSVASLLSITGIAIALAACGAGMPAPAPATSSVPAAAATISAAVLPAQAVAQLQQTCNVAAPLLSAATSPIAPGSVSEPASYAAAYCSQLAAAASVGGVPITTNASTPSWLPKVIAGVQIAGQVAKYALPIILPLL